MKKIVPIWTIMILIGFFASCTEKSEEDRTKEVESEYPEDFNVRYWYEFDHEINIKENKYMLDGCYPETDLYMPFSVEDKNWFYNEIMRQDLLNYNWTFSGRYLHEKNLSCPQVSPDSNLFSIRISIKNKTNEIIESDGDCCCLIYPSDDEYIITKIRWLNETEIYKEINDSIALKIYHQQKEIWIFSEEIKSMINSKKIKYNITEPELNPDCGYI